jgi:hypothetical protein
MSLREKPGTKEVFPDSKRGDSRLQDNRYAGSTPNKVRQEQKRLLVINNIVRNAEQTRKMGMEVSPEQDWVLSNKQLFL